MSSLSVLKYPNKTLKKVSKPLKEVPPSIRDFIRDLFETMVAENGIGLAAPQVGELIRVVVLDVPIQDTIDPEKFHSDRIALINPEIKESSGLIQFEEGCLSCPELIVKVDRQALVRVAYLNDEGKPCELSATGLKGVCIQHEIDHLNGILLVDKLGKIEQDQYRQHRIRKVKDSGRPAIL